MMQISALIRVIPVVAYKEMLLFLPSYESMLTDYSLNPPTPVFFMMRCSAVLLLFYRRSIDGSLVEVWTGAI